MNLRKIIPFYIISIFLGIYFLSLVHSFILNPLTAIIFPVNNSLWETNKLFFITILIINMFLYFKLNINQRSHIVLATFIHAATLITIYNVFYLIFKPSNELIINLIILFGIIIGTYLWYKIIISVFSLKVLNHCAVILTFNALVLFAVLTYHPVPNSLFYDHTNKRLGLFKYNGHISD